MTDGSVAEVKSVVYFWPGDIEAEDGSEDFFVDLMVFIGDGEDERRDNFDLRVCSPSKLTELYAAEHWDDDDTLPGGNVWPVTGLWLMRTWSKTDLEAALARLVRAHSPGPDFGTVAARIGRYAPWEYDYRYDDDQNSAVGLPRTTSFWHDD